MSSVTTDPSLVPSPPLSDSHRSLPSLEELYEWTSEPDHRVVIQGVDWAFYEQLVDSIPEGSNVHVDYDGKDVEIMSLSPFHDGVKKFLGRFVELTAEELEIPCTGLGQTTWKRPRLSRGLEADECYYFVGEKLTAAAGSSVGCPRMLLSTPILLTWPSSRRFSLEDRPAWNLRCVARSRGLAVRRRTQPDGYRRLTADGTYQATKSNWSSASSMQGSRLAAGARRGST